MKNSNIFIQILSSSSSKKSIVHVKSRFPSTLSREICADVSNKDFRGTLTLREGWLHISELMRNLEKIRVKNINSNDFFLIETFFSKLKQFLRMYSPIA